MMQKSKQKASSSTQTLIKQSIAALKEMPGSTFNSILEYIKGKWGNVRREEVLDTMKRMRRTGELIQIKYYFRTPRKEVKTQLHKLKGNSVLKANKTEKEETVKKAKADKAGKRKHASIKNGLKNSSKAKVKTRILKRKAKGRVGKRRTY
eukprot:TRINITY_DN7469_c0_g1_i11.p1 TRINITY_DN7469_c0_g1~~TRINITY_DN7469_c0_g1_i11.p1  ORF type:complete len:150 (+),score=42.49 TRINITY_DN7469_c0_g1_i11:236-685(+)